MSSRRSRTPPTARTSQSAHLITLTVWLGQGLHELHHLAKSAARGRAYPGIVTSILFVGVMSFAVFPMWHAAVIGARGLRLRADTERVAKARAKLAHELKRDPYSEELAAALGIDAAELSERVAVFAAEVGGAHRLGPRAHGSSASRDTQSDGDPWG